MTQTPSPAAAPSSEPPLKRTPLHTAHLRAGARMVPFGGWEMPVQYAGVKAEHDAVRTAAGVFDVSHMGEFRITGAGALPFLQGVTTNDVSKLAPAAPTTTGCRAKRAGWWTTSTSTWSPRAST